MQTRHSYAPFNFLELFLSLNIYYMLIYAYSIDTQEIMGGRFFNYIFNYSPLNDNLTICVLCFIIIHVLHGG